MVLLVARTVSQWIYTVAHGTNINNKYRLSICNIYEQHNVLSMTKTLYDYTKEMGLAIITFLM